VTKRQRSRPIALREAIDAYLERAGLAVRLEQAALLTAWPGLVGPQIAAVARAESVSPDGTLFVRVATHPWMTELQLLTPEIMARINAGRGSGRVRAIRWLLSSSPGHHGQAERAHEAQRERRLPS